MENLKVPEIDFASHNDKCRICFKLWSPNEHRIQISKGIERKFLDFTQIEVSFQ